MKKSMITLGLLASFCAQASEIDSFTQRYQPIEDASTIINRKANDYIKDAIQRANDNSSCVESDLIKEIRKDFNIILNEGKLVNEIVSNDEIPKHSIPRSESIFKYHKITDGYLLARPAADRDGIGMGTTMNFNGIYIGSDKFEHMFGQGFHYYRRFYLSKVRRNPTLKGPRGRARNKFDLRTVLLIGNANERLHLGGNPIATGVYTFGDLVANIQGMRFWNHLLQKGEDILGDNIGPYIECNNNKWEQVKEVDFKYYVDDGFDEGINCSALITRNGYRGVMKSLDELKQSDPEHVYSCPIDIDKLEQVKKKYEVPVSKGSKKTIKDYIFNPWNKIVKYKSWWWL